MKRSLSVPSRAGRPASKSRGHARATSAVAPFDLDLTRLLAARADGMTTAGVLLMARQLTGRASLQEAEVLTQLNDLAGRGLVKLTPDNRWIIAL